MKMKRRLGWCWAAVGVGAVLLGAFSPPLAPAEEEKQVRLEVEITAEETGQPIENATVYVKYKQERFLRKDKERSWSAKTDSEGKAAFPPLPEGEVLVQVVVKGWKPYGRFHYLRAPKHVLEIKLKPPKKWY